MPEPRKWTEEELRDLGRRAREVGAQLREATAQLVESLKQCEKRFAYRLGTDARGRVSLRTNKNGFIEHLVFQRGRFIYESGRPGRPLKAVWLPEVDEREILLLAVDKLRDLWTASGGAPV